MPEVKNFAGGVYIAVRSLYDIPMTTTTISVTDCPITPYRPTEHTNYLVRVAYEYDIVDYNVFGRVGMPEHELLAAIQARYPRDEATSIVRWAEL